MYHTYLVTFAATLFLIVLSLYVTARKLEAKREQELATGYDWAYQELLTKSMSLGQMDYEFGDIPNEELTPFQQGALRAMDHYRNTLCDIRRTLGHCEVIQVNGGATLSFHSFEKMVDWIERNRLGERERVTSAIAKWILLMVDHHSGNVAKVWLSSNLLRTVAVTSAPHAPLVLAKCTIAQSVGGRLSDV